jgi:hypothetical protein
MGGIYEVRRCDGFSAMIHIPSFIKTGSGIENLMGRIHRHTDSTVIAYAYFYFSKIKKVG